MLNTCLPYVQLKSLPLGLIATQQTEGWLPKSPGKARSSLEGGSLSPGNLSRVTFVFFENENGSRKCHWVIEWRERLTKKTNHSHRLADSSAVTQQLWPGLLAASLLTSPPLPLERRNTTKGWGLGCHS